MVDICELHGWDFELGAEECPECGAESRMAAELLAVFEIERDRVTGQLDGSHHPYDAGVLDGLSLAMAIVEGFISE